MPSSTQLQLSISLDDFLTSAGALLVGNSTGFSVLPIGAAGQVLTVTAGLPSWADPEAASPVEAFLDLSDVPATYAGHASKFVKVKADQTGLEFVAGSDVSVAWGSITGTLSSQADLNAALNGKQAADATLTALAGVTTAANKLIYATGADTFATTDLTSVSRTMLANTTVDAWLEDLGLVGAANGTFAELIVGNPVTTSSDWFGTFTDQKLSIGMGSTSTPTTLHQPAAFIETFTSGPYTSGHFFTSGQFIRSVRSGNNSSGAMNAATFQIEDRSTGSAYGTVGNDGDHIACHAVGLVESSRGGSGAAAFWGEAGTPRTNTGNSWTAGMELNVYQRFVRNQGSNYIGDPLIDVVSAGHGCSLGLWVQNFQWAAVYADGTVGNYWNDFGIVIESYTAKAPYRGFGYQTGIYIADTYNEAIRIRGGIGDQINNAAYKTDTGLHFEGHFWKGIRLDSATCHAHAIKLGANRMNFGNYTNSFPENGDVWSDGTHIYCRLGGVTKQLD